MISETNLIGWLVFYRLQCSNDAGPTMIPDGVEQALVAKGWIESEGSEDWQGNHNGRITDLGVAVSDLAAPEWGVTSLPVTQRGDVMEQFEIGDRISFCDGGPG